MNPLGTVPVLVSQDEGSIVGIKAIRKHLETRPDLTDHHLFKGKSFQLCYAIHFGALMPILPANILGILSDFFIVWLSCSFDLGLGDVSVTSVVCVN